jgi:glutamate formiminotransferase/formiminotetrahydrofolate cyclodeaminase
MPDASETLTGWLAAIAAPTPSPAGGSAAAIAGALGAALAEMVAGLTARREKYAAVHPEARQTVERAAGLRTHLAALAVRDAEAFTGFTAALALPKRTAEEQAARASAREAALQEGAAVQLELLDGLAETADLAAAMTERGLAGALGDAATGALLAAAAARSACWAIRSNLEGTGDRVAAAQQVTRAGELLDRVERAERRVLEVLRARVV